MPNNKEYKKTLPPGKRLGGLLRYAPPRSADEMPEGWYHRWNYSKSADKDGHIRNRTWLFKFGLYKRFEIGLHVQIPSPRIVFRPWMMVVLPPQEEQ